VKIQQLDGAICMSIEDDGKGFQEGPGSRAKKGERLGLLGMRERLEMVGGSFAINSKPGKGTIVLAQVPLINGKPVGGGGEAELMHIYQTRTRL